MSVIWESAIDDGKYSASVTEDDEAAHLILRDEGNAILLDEIVALSYGAIFGPDVEDVALWQERCIEVIDNA